MNMLMLRKQGCRILYVTMTIAVVLSYCLGCSAAKAPEESNEITIFAASSLNKALDEIIRQYEADHPGVTIRASYDSSGKLASQILEGAACDLFFSASEDHMKRLEENNLLVEASIHNVLQNQVCVVTYKCSETKVTGLVDIGKAKSLALAGGSVPVGRYTRQAMISLHMLEATEDAASISTQTIQDALGVEINECANVSTVKTSVAEGINEVGTVYYSDTYGLEDRLVILERVPLEYTGEVIYPLALIRNGADNENDETGAKRQSSLEAEEFLNYLLSAEALDIFESYYYVPCFGE